MRVSTEVTRKKPSSRRRRVKIVFVIVIPGYGCVTRPSKQCCRGDAGDRHSVVMLYLSLLQVPLADDKIAARRSFASGRRRRRCATREPGQTTHTHFAHASLQLCVTKRPTTNQTRARARASVRDLFPYVRLVSGPRGREVTFGAEHKPTTLIRRCPRTVRLPGNVRVAVGSRTVVTAGLWCKRRTGLLVWRGDSA